MKKLLFIYNRYAGKGRVHLHLADILDAFAQAGWQITVHPTRGAGDAAQAVGRAGGGVVRVVWWGRGGASRRTGGKNGETKRRAAR